MLIYEVTATVEREIAVEFEKYMSEEHISDVLATGYFSAAFFAKSGSQYRIGYHADSQEALDSYLATEAIRLRSDFSSHFPTGIKISRQVLDIVKLFPGQLI